MAKKYVGVTTLQALMEIIKGELGTTQTNITNILDSAVLKENIVTSLDGYEPDDPDYSVASATIVAELKDAIDQLTGADGADGKDGVAVTFGDMIKTWEGYDVDTDADKVVAAALIKAIKDQVDALSTTVAEELEGQKGEPGGIATLGEDGKVPSEQLPSYVDDVIEGFSVEAEEGNPSSRVFYEPNEDGTAASTTEIVGEKSKIYIDLSTNYSYRWSGSVFVRVNEVDLVEMTEDEVEQIWNEVLAEVASKEDNMEEVGAEG